jgi:hypothetical protein
MTKAAGTVTLKLTLKRAEATPSGKHPGRKPTATIHLTFVPEHGKRLSASVTV